MQGDKHKKLLAYGNRLRKRFLTSSSLFLIWLGAIVYGGEKEARLDGKLELANELNKHPQITTIKTEDMERQHSNTKYYSYAGLASMILSIYTKKKGNRIDCI